MKGDKLAGFTPAGMADALNNILQGEIVDQNDTERAAPAGRDLVLRDVLQPAFSNAQMSVIMNKTPDYAIKKRQGPSGKSLAYVKHGYVTDTLNKAFGFDWDLTLMPMDEGRMYAIQIEEIPVIKNSKPTGEVRQTRHIAVCGKLTVRVRNPANFSEVITTITKDGFGSQLWLPGIEFGDALKAARSDLVKTCAYQLGIALDLYWDDAAELNSHEEKLRQAAVEAEEALKAAAVAKEKAEKEAAELLSKPPQNIATFYARCLSDYGVTAQNIEESLEITVGRVASATPGEIEIFWNKVVSHFGLKE